MRNRKDTGMEIELDQLSLKELRDLQKKVTRQIDTFEARQKEKAISAAAEAAAEYGFSLKELLGTTIVGKSPVAPKYMHPGDGSVTWTGRGRQPVWVRDYLEAGGSLEDLLIAKT